MNSNGTKGVHLRNQEIHHVQLSNNDRASSHATPETIAEAVTYLHRDGIVVLDDAIDPAHLDALNDILGPEAEEIARDPDHHFNFGKETRNMDQAPPLVPELMFKDVWANPIACSILRAMLGGEIVCHYANGKHGRLRCLCPFGHELTLCPPQIQAILPSKLQADNPCTPTSTNPTRCTLSQ